MIIGSAFLPAYKAGHPADLPVIFPDEGTELREVPEEKEDFDISHEKTEPEKGGIIAKNMVVDRFS
jgi:hypothetical protein